MTILLEFLRPYKPCSSLPEFRIRFLETSSNRTRTSRLTHRENSEICMLTEFYLFVLDSL